jgi:hypothetical protein
MGHQSQLVVSRVRVKVFNLLRGIYETFFTAMRLFDGTPYGKQNVCYAGL